MYKHLTKKLHEVESLLERDTHLVQSLSCFMEPDVSLPCSQQPTAAS
jgi:hypothetical protein